MHPIPDPVVLIRDCQLVNHELDFARVSHFVMPVKHGDFYFGGEDEVNHSNDVSVCRNQFFTGG